VAAEPAAAAAEEDCAAGDTGVFGLVGGFWDGEAVMMGAAGDTGVFELVGGFWDGEAVMMGAAVAVAVGMADVVPYGLTVIIVVLVNSEAAS
jgi:hypothetical protein